MLTPLNSALQEYQNKYRHPGQPKLKSSKLYALFHSEQSRHEIQMAWPSKYPNSDAPGVYLIYDGAGTPLYVGKASMGERVGTRLGKYFTSEASTGGCLLLSKKWKGSPMYVVTIPVTEGFEAPSLEEFLIAKLCPTNNSQGK